MFRTDVSMATPAKGRTTFVLFCYRASWDHVTAEEKHNSLILFPRGFFMFRFVFFLLHRIISSILAVRTFEERGRWSSVCGDTTLQYKWYPQESTVCAGRTFRLGVIKIKIGCGTIFRDRDLTGSRDGPGVFYRRPTACNARCGDYCGLDDWTDFKWTHRGRYVDMECRVMHIHPSTILAQHILPIGVVLAGFFYSVLYIFTLFFSILSYLFSDRVRDGTQTTTQST